MFKIYRENQLSYDCNSVKEYNIQMQNKGFQKYTLLQTYIFNVLKIDLKHQPNQTVTTRYFKFDTSEEMIDIQSQLKNSNVSDIVHQLKNKEVYFEPKEWESLKEKTQKMQDLSQSFSQPEDQVSKQKRKRIRKQRKEKESKMKQKIVQLQKQISQGKKLQQAEKYLNSTINNLKYKYQNVKGKLKTDYQQRVNNLKLEHADQIKMLKNQYRGEILELNEQIQNIIQDGGSRYLRRQLQQEKTRFNLLNDRYEKLRERMEMGGYVPPQEDFYNRGH